jgi:DNA polymerase III epsilon subunit-like protein
MIIIDTETTGLDCLPETAPLSMQPRIIELAALKVDYRSLKVVDQISFLCHPGMGIPAEITKITGLKDEDLVGALPFGAHYEELVQFALGELFLVAHNLNFDRQLIHYELARMGKALQFPWPPRHICTVEITLHLGLVDRKFSTLWKYLTGEELKQSHRAMDDVLQLLEALKWLKKKKLLVV